MVLKVTDQHEALIGHDAIMTFIDPKVSRSYYQKKIVPRIKDILLKRTYAGWGKPKIITYKTLLLARLLEIKDI